MSDQRVYKQIVKYWDDLHHDIGQLTVLVEQLMDEEGYISIPKLGNRACYQLTSHYANSDRWRPGYITRVYIPDSGDAFESTAVFLISLESDTSLDFPAVICGHYVHKCLDADGIAKNVVQSYRLRTLTRQESDWKDLQEDHGWVIARPKFDGPIEFFKGYILNLFDMIDQQHVIDNMVQPLIGIDGDLNEMLTVERYTFPELDTTR